MRYGFVCVCLMLLPQWSVAEEVRILGGTESFLWQEFDNSDRELLNETGMRYFVELVGDSSLTPNWSMDVGVRLYSGTVDYDGQTMAGDPIQTDTDYAGYRLEMGGTYSNAVRASLAKDEWQLRVAIGVDSWRRELRDSVLNGGPVYGYTERYTTTYTSAGLTYLREAWAIGLGVKAPLYTTEVVDLSGSEVTLHPKGQLSLFADVDIPVTSQWSIVLNYDGYRFNKSDLKSGMYQPKSYQTTLGAALIYRF